MANHVSDQLRRKRIHGVVDESPSVQEFWNTAHREGMHLWLTGSEPREVFRRLGIEERLFGTQVSELEILNVGVGEGYCTRYLSEHGAVVDCLDISEVALKRVRPFSRQRFLTVDDCASNSYDLIIHHLVAQHMSHIDLQRQMAGLIRALKPQGILAIQYAGSAHDDSLTTWDPDERMCKTGGVLRSNAFFSELVTKAGGKVENMTYAETNLRYGSRFAVAHIVRA